MLIVFIRGIILYGVVIASTRLMGKRQLGELSPGELVVAILISNIATLCMEDVDLPLLYGLVPILTLVSIDVIVSCMCLKSRKLRKAVSGSPKVIISKGKIDQSMLHELRYSVEDVLAALRAQGIFDISQVQYAIVETTGSVSVLQKEEYQPLSRQGVMSPKKSSDPPKAVIIDGEIIDRKTAAELDLRAEGVFLCTVDEKGKAEVVKKADN